MSKRKKWRNRPPQQPITQPSKPAQPQQPQRVVHAEIRQTQGPLPTPEDLAKYEQLYPGAAKQIFDQFKDQSTHRMALENRVINSNISNSRLGQWMGFSICMTALIGGGVLAIFGIKIEGIIIAAAGLVSLVTVFVTGKFTGQKELRAKRLGQ